jgi:hypothetical protein
MTPTRHEPIDILFHEVFGIALDQWDNRLAKVCAGDDELRWEVKSLPALSEEAETFSDGIRKPGMIL